MKMLGFSQFLNKTNKNNVRLVITDAVPRAAAIIKVS